MSEFFLRKSNKVESYVSLFEKARIQIEKNITELNLSVLPGIKKLEPNEVKNLMELLKNSSCSLLNLDWNELGDEGIDLICKNFPPSIIHLSLGWNKIGKKGAFSIAELVSQNLPLEILDLPTNQIGNEGITHISKALLKNTNLKSLNLYDNKIDNDGIKVLFEVLLHSNIEKLILGLNKIDQTGISFLPQLLITNEFLVYLDLYGNKIGPDGASKLAQGLKSRCVLQRLNLQGNKIENTGAINLIDSLLSANCFLEMLNLADNNLENDGAKAIAKLILYHHSLHSLDLSINQIKKEGGLALFEALYHNYSLRFLDLDKNLIDFDGREILFPKLESNHTIQNINISQNPCSSILETSIHKTLKKNEHFLIFDSPSSFSMDIITKINYIRVLVLRGCNLIELPELELPSLLVLDLQNNKISKFPNFKNLSNLKFINIAKNSIEFPNISNEFTFSNFREYCSFDWQQIPNTIQHMYILGNKGVNAKILDYMKSIIKYIQLISFVEPEESDLLKVLLWFEAENNLSINQILEKTKELKKFSRLNFSSLDIKPSCNISLEIRAQLTCCNHLVLYGNSLKTFPPSLLTLNWIKKINIKKNLFDSLPQELQNFAFLNEIWLEENQFTTFPEVLLTLPRLQRIWLDNNQISSLSTLESRTLQSLSMVNNSLNVMGGLVSCVFLQVLLLNNNFIQIVPPEIKQLIILKKLHLNNNKITFLPEEIGELKYLEELHLRENLLSSLPLKIGNLNRLRSLDLYNNKLAYLPVSIGHLSQLEYCNLKKNQFFPPLLEFTDDLSKLRGYCSDVLFGSQKCNFVKLVVVGEENVGKTTLVRALIAFVKTLPLLRKRKLVKLFNNPPLSTDGIEISKEYLSIKVDPTFQIPNNELILNLWDFGGQQVYYSTHGFFISAKSLFVLTWNVTKPTSEIERIIYWKKTIENLSAHPVLILVGTHLDTAIQLCLDTETILREMSQKTGIPLERVIAVSCSDGENFQDLVQLITKSAMELPLTGTPLPLMYLNLKTRIEAESKKLCPPIISINKLKDIASEYGIVGEKTFERALEFLHILGFCLYFPNDPFLKNYVVLDVQWLSKVLATLVSTKSIFIQKGILEHRHLQILWKSYPPETHKILLRVMEQFHTAIQITNNGENIYEGRSIVPALLTSNGALDFFETWDPQNNTLKRFYSFESYIPPDFFHRLMGGIILSFGIQNTVFWQNGITIQQPQANVVIILNSTHQGISMTFAGKNWFQLFLKLKKTTEMLLSKWENSEIKTFIACPFCCKQSKDFGEWNYCFSWAACCEVYYAQKARLFCHKSKQLVPIEDLLPEIVRSSVKIINSEDIEIKEKLGEGTEGLVYRAIFENKEYAIKKLILFPSSEREAQLREFFQEVDLINETHPNLVQIIGITFNPLSLLLPIASFGSLFDAIQNKAIDIKIPMLLRISFDVANGMNYLHNLQPAILHCDLRSPNILIFNDDITSESVAKITDFSLYQYELGRLLIRDYRKFNPNWSSPEILREEEISKFSDVFSFGMVLYELLMEEIPYSSKFNSEWKFKNNVEIAVTSGIRPPYNKEELNKKFGTEVPINLYHILEACWTDNPLDRPTFRIIRSTLGILLQPYWSGVKDILEKEHSVPGLTRSEKFGWNIHEFQSINYFVKETYQLEWKDENSYFSVCSIDGRKGVYMIEKFLHSYPLEKVFKEMTRLKVFTLKGGHPNVIKLLGYHHSLDSLILIYEHFEEGTLYSLILQKFKTNNYFEQKEILNITLQIARGLNYLHIHEIYHKKLKSSKIYVKLKDISSVESVHLIGFGSSLFYPTLDQTPYPYMSPELINFSKNPSASIDYFASDIWSLGILFFELVHLHYPEPLQEKSRPEWAKEKREWKSFYELYLKTTEIDPKLRPSSTFILMELETIKLKQ